RGHLHHGLGALQLSYCRRHLLLKLSLGIVCHRIDSLTEGDVTTGHLIHQVVNEIKTSHITGILGHGDEVTEHHRELIKCISATGFPNLYKAVNFLVGCVNQVLNKSSTLHTHLGKTSNNLRGDVSRLCE